ncbi:hypothetical protein HanPSC8_Chr12g0539231 [Helianthus annuus]|nr:hypothetical protein HanPSC8_Chr12g0539231 [Helianthus annuus]
MYKTSGTCLQWRVSPFGVEGFGPLGNSMYCRPALFLRAWVGGVSSDVIDYCSLLAFPTSQLFNH